MVAFSKVQLLISATVLALPSVLALPLSSHRDLMHPFKRQNDPALAQRYEDILSTVQLNEYASTLYQNFRSKDQKKVFLRKPYLNLADAIKTVKPKLTIKSSQISLYADLLQFAGDVPIEMPQRTTLYLFAREVSALDSQKGSLTIKYDESVIVYFATPQLPKDFNVKFVDAGGSVQDATLNVPDNGYGLLVEVTSGTTLNTQTLDAPDFALKSFDYMGDLNLTNSTFIEDDLPRLLQFQQVLATAWKDSDPAAAMDIYNFIIKTSTGSTPALPIYQQAVSSRAKLCMITDPLQKYVPNLDITQIKSIVNDHLAVAKTFEDSFNQFSQLEADAKEAKASAVDAFTNSKLAVQKYKFLEEQAKTRLAFAVKALDDAVFNYNMTYNDIPVRFATYKAGIAAYATDQRGKLLVKVIMAVATIVIAVASAGAGAPAAAPAAAGSASTFATVLEAQKFILDNAGTVTEGITGIASEISSTTETINYMMDHISKGVTTMATTMATLNAVLGTTSAGMKPNSFTSAVAEPFGAVLDINQRVDAINLSASWDNWRVLNEMAWSKMSEDHKAIDGASDYYSALYSLSNHGKAVVAAQAAYVEVFDDYMEASVNLKTAAAQTLVLEGAVSRIEDPHVFQTFKRAMFDRLIAVRSWVAVEFNDYAAAYNYYTLSTSPPKTVPVLSPASFYSQAVSELQSSATHAQTGFRSQIQTFTISSTDKATPFGANWLKELQTSAGLTFSIPSSSEYFSKVSRVRVQRLRCYFIGSTADEVQASLTISGSFEDKSTSAPYSPLRFISDSTPLGFHYVPSFNDPKEPNASMIRMDGEYANEKVFMTPAPFASWNIKLENPTEALNGATKMVLLITAEVTRH